MLPQFALNLLSLPHSSASCERIFSKSNLLKTRLRNKLTTETVKGNIAASESVKENGCCFNYAPTKAVLSRMTSACLYPKDETNIDQDSDGDEFFLE